MVQFLKKIFEKNNKEKKKETSCATETRKLRARKEILFLLRGIRYSVFAKCEHCGKKISEENILAQFPKDKYILFLNCASCNRRMIPKIKFNGSSCWLLTPYVTLNGLKNEKLETLNPDDIATHYERTYHSAVFHFGSLRNAFLLVGKKYTFVEIPDWQEKIHNLVGKFSISFIANTVGVSEKKVQRFIKSL